MSLSIETIEKNWKSYLWIIDKHITDRKESVLAMVNELADTISTAPSSCSTNTHGAYPGGYLEYVLKSVKGCADQMKLYSSMGVDINFTAEELIMSALFHDLGKIGDSEKELYVIQDDAWRKEKLNEAYKINPEVATMTIPDRSLYLLQKYGIRLTRIEYMAIKLYEGQYNEGNKHYFQSYSDIKTMLPYVIQTGVFMAKNSN